MDIIKLVFWILLLQPLAINDWRYKQTRLYTWLGLIILTNIHIYLNENDNVLVFYLLIFNFSQIILCFLPNKLYLGLGLADYRLLICAGCYFKIFSASRYLLISCLLICVHQLYLNYKQKKGTPPPYKRVPTYPLLAYFYLANFLDLVYLISCKIFRLIIIQL